MPATIEYDRIVGLNYQDGSGGARSKRSGSYVSIPMWEQFDASGCETAVDSFSVGSASRTNVIVDEALCRFDEFASDSMKITGSLALVGSGFMGGYWGILIEYVQAAFASISTPTQGVYTATSPSFLANYPRSRPGRTGHIDPRSGSILSYLSLSSGQDRCGSAIQVIEGTISVNQVDENCTYTGRADISYMLRYRLGAGPASATDYATKLNRDDIAGSNSYSVAATFAAARTILGLGTPPVTVSFL